MSGAGDGISVAAHELIHTFGAVQASAPHATLGGHCTDGADIMCYNDGTVPSYPHVLRCPLSYGRLLDCGADDYFAITPTPGSYLATHWNVADSSFLIGGGSGAPSADLVTVGLAPAGSDGVTAAGSVAVAVDVLAAGWAPISEVEVERSADDGATWTALPPYQAGATSDDSPVVSFSDSAAPGTYTWQARAQDVSGAWSPWTSSPPLTVAPPAVSFSLESITMTSTPASGTLLHLSGTLGPGTATACRADYRVIGQAWTPVPQPPSGCSIDGSGAVSLPLALGHAAPSGIAYELTFTDGAGSGPGDAYAGIVSVGSAP